MERRRLLNYFLGSSFLATAAAFIYPVVRYLLPPRQSEAVQKRIVAARAGELAPNSAKIIKFGSRPAILVMTAEGKPVALSAVCTHLTCTVSFEADSQTLFCPCHNGRFDLAGNVLSGPPPAPLETYTVEMSGADIIISVKS
jgi:Rieske Fe-S protein